MNYEDIKKLIDDMGESKIDSLEIEFPEGMKISMKKNENILHTETRNSIVQPTTEINVNTETNIEKDSITKKEDNNYKIVKSPMVGTFYESASPKEKPFVKVGDKVKKGDVLCIVEAMKLMNEIESEFDGEIIEICVKNEDILEYGKPLFKIK